MSAPPRHRRLAGLMVLALAGAARASEVSPAASEVSPPAPAPPREPAPFALGLGFYFRLGGLYIAPTGKSQPVVLENVSPMAQLAGLHDGPIAGSWASMGSNLMAAATIGYALPFLDRSLSIETILALPFAMKMRVGGTLATTSLAPAALGTLPTGVPPLGTELGEVTVLPPVLTLVYRFFPRWRIHPYLGAGASLMLVLGAKITNPVLAEVAQPKVVIPPKVGWVVQAGLEARLWGPFFLTGDFKYIGGLDVTARVTDLWVRLPSLPLYGAAKVGDNVVTMSINPIVVQLGIGMNL